MADPVYVAYLVAFGTAAVACFASAVRARRVDDPDTRRGLVGLLVASGGWASAHVVFFFAPTTELKVATYVAGLVVGFGTVGPWLYFCSAYTGRTLHRNPTVRRVAVGLFLAVALVKVTNPLHGLYFTTEFVATPFAHLAVRTGLLHWAVMALSYALAAVGYFMLFELSLQVDFDTGPFVALVTVTGLPVVLDVVGFASPLLVDVTYEPLGVAAFAVGVSFLYFTRFQTLGIVSESEAPVVVVSDEGRVREANRGARELFPALADPGALGEPLESVAPALADALGDENPVVELEREDGARYYRVTTSPLGTGPGRRPRLLALTDVTEREQYRQELERQNERLDQFASLVSHDLRNPLSVASGRLELARRDHESDHPEAVSDHESDHLEAVSEAHARMEDIVEDVLTLARQGEAIEEVEPARLSSLAGECWSLVDTGEADLVVEDDLTLVTDPARLRHLLENLFRNAVEHGSTTPRTEAEDSPDHGEVGVTVRVGALEEGEGFYVADDGPGLEGSDPEQVFESGYTTSDEGTGLGLAIVTEVVDAHGWSIDVGESDTGGVRFEITGVTVEQG